MCSKGGFNLTKFVSNSKDVVNAIEDSDKSKSLKNLDITSEPLPVERALGVQWCVENDCFIFSIKIKEKPATRRGILSAVSSVFEPLGFAAPFMLKIKQMLQELCAENKSWDEELSCQQKLQWQNWQKDVVKLESCVIQRCVKPVNFGVIVNVSLHHFSDAAEKAYGQVSYLRLENAEGEVSCSMLIGKARVAPLKMITIPRMELTAATLSVKMSKILKEELEYKNYDEYYWTDSQVVLSYLNNPSKRFKVFVANRVATILDHSTKEQWRYVPSSQNPADDASRGLSIKKFLENKRWFCGHDFLLVCPGVRPTWAEKGDQKRFMTPAQAIKASANFLVIGRPITTAKEPAEAWEKICAELM